MQEDYKVIEIGEHKVKVRTYITGADKEAVDAVVADNTKVVIDDKNKAEATADAGVEAKVRKVLIQRFVQEVDGSTEKMAERLGNFLLDDYEAFVKELDTITARIGLNQKKKDKQKADSEN